MSTTSTFSFDDFLAALPAERQAMVREVWQAVRHAMPAGFTERSSARSLSFGAGPEMYVALMNHKSYVSLYLMALYVFPEHRAELQEAAPKLKFGNSCLNFTKAARLPLDTIGRIIGAHTPADYLQQLQANRE
jgi:hypothetical protein